MTFKYRLMRWLMRDHMREPYGFDFQDRVKELYRIVREYNTERHYEDNDPTHAVFLNELFHESFTEDQQQVLIIEQLKGQTPPKRNPMRPIVPPAAPPRPSRSMYPAPPKPWP